MSVESVPPPSDSADPGVPWHYGDPLAEQRELLAGTALVDLSHRGVVTIVGPDRLDWLNDLTTAKLDDLPPGIPRLALILDPHGRVEQELHLVDDGTTTWIAVEPGAATPLVEYLRSMQFLRQVEVSDVSSDWAVIGSVGRREPLAPPLDPLRRRPAFRQGPGLQRRPRQPRRLPPVWRATTGRTGRSA